MAQYACIIQSGQVAEARQAELSDGLKRIAHDLLGDVPDAVDVKWITVREGFGFTAGRPSRSSLVVRSVPNGYPDDRRTKLLSTISDLWQDVTGCGSDEIVVTAMDGPLPL